jgi:octaprenyl-diphosphate synthase
MLSVTAREILGLVRDDLIQVERAISLESVASVDAITTIGQYIHEAGGKRLRPTLLLLCSRLCGGGGDSAVRMGAVVEMIHAATLVHDDIIDDARTRRGRPSTNIKWGNHTSVLAGDWLYMQAFQMALRDRNFHVLDVLISVTQMMVEGELMQLQRIGSIAVTEADYMDLVDRKTAALFAACARLGAVTAEAKSDDEDRLAHFAWNVGMAFQLVDDLLDFTARENVLGKPVGNDLWEGKVTLPLIYALEKAGPDERELIQMVLKDRNYERVSFASVYDIVERHDGIRRVQDRATQFTREARGLLATFPDSRYQRALYAVTELVTDRDH